MTNEQESFEARAKASLDASLASLDKNTQNDLAVIRQKALNTQSTPSVFRFSVWVPASAFAFCILFTVAIIYAPHRPDEISQKIAAQQTSNTAGEEQLAMLEMLTNPEDMDIVADPNFHIWAEEILATEGA